MKDENPSVSGFAVERYIIKSKYSEILGVSKQILQRDDVQFMGDVSIENCGTYVYDKSFSVAEDIEAKDDNFRF